MAAINGETKWTHAGVGGRSCHCCYGLQRHRKPGNRKSRRRKEKLELKKKQGKQPRLTAKVPKYTLS